MARIVEMGGLSVAYAGRLLAELGHDVIRVEPPEGDELRRMPPLLAGKESAYHQFLNAGKRSLSDPGLLQPLLDSADALLTTDECPHPNLVVVRIGDPLPELLLYARSGLLALTGQPDGRPMLLGGHALYSAIGCFAAVALLAALFAGEPQLVELSAEECLATLCEQGVIAETITHERFERRGYRGAVTAISGAFRCADGYAMLSVPPQPDNWRRFMDWVGDPVLSADESLVDEAERRAKKDAVIDRLELWTGTFEKDDLVTEAQTRHTPAAPVSTTLDLVDDPQLTARGFLRTIDHPDLGQILFPVGALANLRGFQPAPAPRLGQHNDELRAELT